MISDQALSLRQNMRKLWSDHVIWTRLYIIAAVDDGKPMSAFLTQLASGVVSAVGTAIGSAITLAGPGDAAAVRLLKNQEDIGNAIVPVYGEAAGKKLTGLLKEHILIAVNLVEAAKAGDDKKFASEDQKWTKNAEDIATFLSNANPNWPKQDVVDLLALHLNLTKNEVTARLKKNWSDDIKAFDDIFTEILTVADTLTDGILKQYPNKFAGDAKRESMRIMPPPA